MGSFPRLTSRTVTLHTKPVFLRLNAQCAWVHMSSVIACFINEISLFLKCSHNCIFDLATFFVFGHGINNLVWQLWVQVICWMPNPRFSIFEHPGPMIQINMVKSLVVHFVPQIIISVQWKKWHRVEPRSGSKVYSFKRQLKSREFAQLLSEMRANYKLPGFFYNFQFFQSL